jgi:periplasmic copper chaperone A
MNRETSLRPLLSLLVAGLLAASGVHAAEADHVRAEGAWIRVLPGALPAGGFVTLHNDGDQPATLRGATSPAYASIMLHQSSTAGGMSRMVMLDRLEVPAHGKVALAPAGYHLMLMGAARPVQPGQTVRLMLQFADGSTLATDFLARPANAMGPSASP